MEDTVAIQVEMMISKSLFKFIKWYCVMVCIEPSEFIASALMYALNQLFEDARGGECFVV